MLFAFVLLASVCADFESFARAIHPWKLTSSITEVLVGDGHILYANVTIGYGMRGFCMTSHPVPRGPIPAQSMYSSFHKIVECYTI